MNESILERIQSNAKALKIDLYTACLLYTSQDGIPKQNCRRHADQDGKEQDQDETETAFPASLFGFIFKRSFANILYNRVRNDENDQSCGNRSRGDRNMNKPAAVLYAVKKSGDHPERHQNRKAKKQNVGMICDRL